MDLVSKSFIKTILKEAGIRPLKKWGQNFLVSRPALLKILKASELKKSDLVLEIGPGIGSLTKELAQRAKKVIAIEKDRQMVKILAKTLKNFKNVKIINQDILKIENSKLKIKNYKVVANLPYYISSAVIKKFLEAKRPPLKMVLMVQKEVGQRITAKPPKMNLLALCVQFYSEPKISSYVSKTCFWPRPKIDSAIVVFEPYPSTPSARNNKDLFFQIVRAGFSHPRKQLVNNLSFGLKLEKKETIDWLTKNQIRPEQRAETLALEDWQNLAKTFKKTIIK